MEQHHITTTEFIAKAAFFLEEAARGVQVVIYTDDEEYRPIVSMLSDRDPRVRTPPIVRLVEDLPPEEIKEMVDALENAAFDHLDPSLDHFLEDEK